MILEELRGLFRDDVSDPALAGVAITRVVLSVDYRHVRAHFVVEEGADRAHVESRLARCTAFLRARLAESIDFKRVPDLGFVFDGATPGGGA